MMISNHVVVLGMWARSECRCVLDLHGFGRGAFACVGSARKPGPSGVPFPVPYRCTQDLHGCFGPCLGGQRGIEPLYQQPCQPMAKTEALAFCRNSLFSQAHLGCKVPLALSGTRWVTGRWLRPGSDVLLYLQNTHLTGQKTRVHGKNFVISVTLPVVADFVLSTSCDLRK